VGVEVAFGLFAVTATSAVERIAGVVERSLDGASSSRGSRFRKTAGWSGPDSNYRFHSFRVVTADSFKSAFLLSQRFRV
jgi:hypothetical protein